MNPLYRGLLVLYALFGLLTAVTMAALLSGMPWPRITLHNYLQIESFYGISYAVLGIYALLGVLIILAGLRREKKKHAVVHEGSLGSIRVALTAIETLVEKVSMEQRGVKEAKALVVSIPQGIGIRIKVTVSPDTGVPQMSDTLQNEVSKNVKEVTGIEVKDIRVSVENITANKPRVE